MDMTPQLWLKILETAGPFICILLFIIIMLFRLLNKRDDIISAIGKELKEGSVILSRLSTLIEVLVGDRKR